MDATDMNVADYTTRKNYQRDYAQSNREAINARKRAWRERKKLAKMTSLVQSFDRVAVINRNKSTEILRQLPHTV